MANPNTDGQQSTSRNDKHGNVRPYTIDYNDIKLAIEKSAKRNDKVSRDLAFTVDPNRLDSLLNNQNITVVRKCLDSRPVSLTSIPLLSEYFTKSRLAWFNEDKEFTTYIFVRSDIDLPKEQADRLLEILHILNDEDRQDEDPNTDEIKLLAELVAYYPCYFATTVSYAKDEPGKYPKLSYSIVCRANKIVIASERYKYNPDDMS